MSKNYFSDIKPAYMYGEDYENEKAKEKEKEGEQVANEDLEPQPVPEINKPAPQTSGADPKTVMGQAVYADSTRLEKQIEGGGASKKKKPALKKSSTRTPAVEDYVHVKAFPRDLYDIIDKAIDDPDATQSEKVSAFVYSLIGEDDMRSVSLYVKELAENYGFDTANEIRSLRDSIDRLTQQSDSMTRMIKELNLMSDEELYVLSFIVFHRLGFSMQPPMAPSETNFNADGVDDIRVKMHKDWRQQREEKKRKDGIRLK